MLEKGLLTDKLVAEVTLAVPGLDGTNFTDPAPTPYHFDSQDPFQVPWVSVLPTKTPGAAEPGGKPQVPSHTPHHPSRVSSASVENTTGVRKGHTASTRVHMWIQRKPRRCSSDPPRNLQLRRIPQPKPNWPVMGIVMGVYVESKVV